MQTNPPAKGRKLSREARFFPMVPIALMALIPFAAQSDELDTLQFRVGQSFQHDNNVFRLSDLANTQAVLGRGDRSDTIGVTTLGVKLDKPYGLQRVELDVSAERNNYRNFSNLSYTAFNYAGAFRWSLTPRFHGNVTSNQREYTDNTADVQNIGALNHRTDRNSLADAEYELGSAWRLVGGVFERSTKNSQPSTFESDFKTQGGEVGARYVFASGTSFAYRYRDGKGNYPGRTLSTFFASDFQDREHEFRLDWNAADRKTQIQARVSHFQRQHDGLSARDFSGMTGQLDLTVNLTGKTSLLGGYARELENYQTDDASYYTGDRLFAGVTYKPTVKTAVRLRYDQGWRDFRGPLPGVVATNRQDKLHLLTLAADWEPIRALKLTAFITRDTRSSSATGFDYKSNLMGVSALASF